MKKLLMVLGISLFTSLSHADSGDIFLSSNFQENSGRPLDARITVSSATARLALTSVQVYDGMMVYQRSDKTTWQLQGSTYTWIQIIPSTNSLTGYSIYPATATAYFPFGLTASTMTISTQTVSGEIVLNDGTIITSTSTFGGSSTSPAGPLNSVQFNSTGTFNGSPTFTTDGSSVTISTMVATNLVNVGPNISITSSTQNMTITNTKGVGIFADPEAFSVYGSTAQNSACIGFHVIGEGSGLPGWAQCRHNTALQFGIKSVTGGMNDVMVMDDVNGTTPRITFNNPVYLGNSSSLNALAANIQQTSMTVTGNGGLGVTYNVNAGSMTGAGLTNCSGVSNAVTWNSGTSLFGCNTISGSGGGASTLGVAQGQVLVSSPTALISVDSNTMNVTLQGGATAYITINTSSITAQGNFYSLSGLAASTGTLTTAVAALNLSTAAIESQVNGKINFSSITATAPVLWNNGTGVISFSQTVGQPETFTSSITVTSPSGANVIYEEKVGSMTVLGPNTTLNGVLMAWPSSGTIGNYLQYNSTNTLQWVSVPAGSGGGGSGSGTVNAANQFSAPYYSVAGSSNVLSAYPNITLSTMTGINISTGMILGAAGYTVSISSNMILGAKTTFYAIGNAVIDGMNFFDNATTTGPYTAYQVNASTPTLTLNSIGIQSGSNQTRCPLDITFPNNQIMDQVQVTGTRNWYQGQFQTVPLLQAYGWLGVGSTPLYEEITSSGTHMFFGQSSSTDTLQFWNSSLQEAGYVDSGGGFHWNGTAAFPNAGNFYNGSVSAGQFYRANLNGTAQLVSYDLLNTTQTWTGLNTYSSPSGLDINYGLLTGTATIYSTSVSSEALVVKSTTGVTAFSVANSSVTPGDFMLTISTGLGVTASKALTVDTSGNGIFLGNVTSTALGGSGTQCVQVDNTGKFNGSGGSCGGGGGGASSLGVNFKGVSITTPTAQINFVGPGVYVTATGSTATVTISSWPAGGVSSGTIVQTIISSVTASSTTVATSFANTGLSVTITPKSTADYVRLFVHGPMSSSAGAPVYITLSKAGANMMASNGCAEFDPDSTLLGSALGQGACVVYDTAPVTSATTYTVQLKTVSGTGGFGDTNVTSYLIAEEINPSGGVPAGVTSIQSNFNPALTGAVTLSSGTNVTLSQVGNTISISASSSNSGFNVGTSSTTSIETLYTPLGQITSTMTVQTQLLLPSSAGALPSANGDIQYDTTANSLRTYNGILSSTVSVPMILFSSAPANDVLISTIVTTTETPFATQYTFPANFFTIGKTIRISVSFDYIATATVPTTIGKARFRKSGPTDVPIYLGTASAAPPSSTYLERGGITFTVICQSTGSSGIINYSLVNGTAQPFGTANTLPGQQAFDTTAAQTFAFTNTFGGSSASNLTRLDLMTIEELN